ncbi:ORF6N domain-containing protein [Solidesulfovibrio sp. C21]|uniref:ORF6N domain-containing protein n=1 Tax=Solidesulfovibrio sp. C21 TaxID=3398613 RepID=UPI0039FBEAA0
MAQAILSEPVVAGNPVIPVESLTPILYKDVPVLTTALLSGVYGTTQGCLRENFRANRERFLDGKHFFKVTGQELRKLRECVRNSDASILPKTGGELTLWTARGAARHAKMLDTDKAWDVFELLEENYFSRRPALGEPTPPSTLSTSSRLSIQNLIAAKVSHYPSELRPKAFKEAWSRVKNKFQVAKYEEIPEATYPDVVSYILAMEMKLALPAAEAPKALPESPKAGTIQEYAWFYPSLPETPDMWRRLSFRAADAFERLGKELDTIKAEAFRVFREHRRSGVATFFDGVMGPHRAMFAIADEHMRTAYRCVYEALDGLIAVHALLKRG